MMEELLVLVIPVGRRTNKTPTHFNFIVVRLAMACSDSLQSGRSHKLVGRPTARSGPHVCRAEPQLHATQRNARSCRDEDDGMHA